MPASVVLPPDRSSANIVDETIDKARRAHDAGVRQVWVAQQLDFDAITLAALIGAAVPGLGVGTSVVPINPRHPMLIAAAAQTAQVATHGNFILGLGLGGNAIEQRAFGISAANTVQRLREHLTVLRAIVDERTVDFHGAQLTAVDTPVMPVALRGAAPFPIYVAAMGPRALRVTGELADGTLPYLAGPRTIEEFIAPTITAAAAEAGRPRPRIIAIVPVAVTDDADAVRAAVADSLAFYDQIPSYQKVLAREGASKAADLAVIGTAQTVTRQLKSYLDAGATEVALRPLQTELTDLKPVWDLAAAF
ncbi:TIGR03564 family F420-dependent LLM class oxidoreductase [Mycobacterium talmoniae]|nr:MULTISPECIES: TIGR03564 family F420-dependent LLM class oxidoreductase [Mycobacterium]OHV02764.1 LLM class F420-dependent oxidoreductase [Mycobacterium talmoniae]TDH50683.1 TIGR03564 family F420-dependent LLM class oxidoreductase [Mycobacterium eburneum]